MRKVDQRKTKMEESFQRAEENAQRLLEIKGIDHHFDFELIYVPRFLVVKQSEQSDISPKAFERLVEENRLKTDM